MILSDTILMILLIIILSKTEDTVKFFNASKGFRFITNEL